MGKTLSGLDDFSVVDEAFEQRAVILASSKTLGDSQKEDSLEWPRGLLALRLPMHFSALPANSAGCFALLASEPHRAGLSDCSSHPASAPS
jgi:hypothetical protein